MRRLGIDLDDFIELLGFPGLILFAITLFALASQYRGPREIKKTINQAALFGMFVGLSLFLVPVLKMTGLYFSEVKVLSYIATFTKSPDLA